MPGHVRNERNEDAGLAGRAGPGRKQDPLRLQGFDFVHGELVVAADIDFGTQLAQILDEVVGEGVVVVEDEDHGRTSVARGLQAKEEGRLFARGNGGANCT